MALVIVSSSPVLNKKEDADQARQLDNSIASAATSSEARQQVSDATVAQIAAAAVPIDAPAVPSGPAATQPAQASPVATPDEDEDEDDDDDDDDDVGIEDITDDDDDDEDDDEENEASSDDDEEEDDEEDYFERFFDDILGGNYETDFSVFNSNPGEGLVTDVRRKSVRFPKTTETTGRKQVNPLAIDWRQLDMLQWLD